MSDHSVSSSKTPLLLASLLFSGKGAVTLRLRERRDLSRLSRRAMGASTESVAGSAMMRLAWAVEIRLKDAVPARA